MNRIAIVSAAIAAAGVISAHATNLAAVIQKVSENCEKIQSYHADVEARYKICPKWYDRFGRYDYRKPDSTRLVLIDSITGTDTAWLVKKDSLFNSCSFYMIPSIMSKPIMSAKMIGAWANSAAAVVYDTLDTCVVKVPENADTLFYSIDMAQGVIFGLDWQGLSKNVTHQYFYGHDKGVYYLQKVSCSNSDTSIMSGGYLFSNIRINGEAVTSVQDRLRPEKSPFTTHPFIGAKPGARIAAFDLFGRNLFKTALQGKGDVLHPDRLCGGARCSSGPLVLRRSGPNGAVSFSTVIVR